jgi:flagellar basal-body rod modification protein FlgD
MATNSITNQSTIQQIIDFSSGKSKSRNTGELGKDDFLNLLVTQLRYQDPLNPVDDKEFIAQMAQFSALEQMQNMNKSFTQSQAYSLMGKRITANIVDEGSNALTVVEGTVTGVKIELGKAYVIVKGKEIPVEQVAYVYDEQSVSNIATYTNLIGTKTKGCIYNPETGEIIVVSGTVKSIQKGLYEDYAMMDGVQLEMFDVIANKPSTEPNFRENYLKDRIGKEVSIEVIDRSNGKKVPVKAILRDFSKSGDGRFFVTLDEVAVPVESISNIAKPQASSNENDLSPESEQ